MFEGSGEFQEGYEILGDSRFCGISIWGNIQIRDLNAHKKNME